MVRRLFAIVVGDGMHMCGIWLYCTDDRILHGLGRLDWSHSQYAGTCFPLSQCDQHGTTWSSNHRIGLSVTDRCVFLDHLWALFDGDTILDLASTIIAAVVLSAIAPVFAADGRLVNLYDTLRSRTG